jgi:hypothetical protein
LPNSLRQISEDLEQVYAVAAAERAAAEADGSALDAFHTDLVIEIGDGQVLKFDIGRHSAPLELKIVH